MHARARLAGAAVEVAPEAGEIVEGARVFVVVEVLAIARQAGLQRIAAAHDDARGRQHRADRADVVPVVRQLVGEHAAAGASSARCVRDNVARAAPNPAAASRRPTAEMRRPRRRDSSASTCGRSASSPAPSTSGCEARICSTSVDPERGRLTMKMTSPPSAVAAPAGGGVNASRIAAMLGGKRARVPGLAAPRDRIRVAPVRPATRRSGRWSSSAFASAKPSRDQIVVARTPDRAGPRACARCRRQRTSRS